MRKTRNLRILSLPLILVLTLSMVLPAAAVFAQSPPPPPVAYYGAITFNGAAAPAGTEITARINSVEVGWLQPQRITLEAGKYGGPAFNDPALIVSGTEQDVGATIEFYVKLPQAQSAIKATETAAWHVGAGRELLNLSARDTISPVAAAGDDKQAWIGAPVDFDGSGSSDNCWVQSYSWDFGDNATASGAKPVHAYAQAGEYTVTLTVADAAGNTASDTLKATVAESPPELDRVVVAPASASLRVNQQQQFSAVGYTSANKAISGITFTWSVVGGGGTIDAASGLFTAGGNVGTFTNTIQAAGTLSGITKTGNATVIITYPTTADFAASPASGAAPLTVSFTDLSLGSPTTWSWDFGDGTPKSNLQNPSHVYNNGGTFTVALTATGPGGASTKTATGLIKIIRAEFSASPTTGTAPATVKFTDASEGSVTSRQWDFNNDGIVDSSEQNPSYTFAAAGNYSVLLRVSGPAGTSSVLKSNYITIYQVPVADFTANVASGAKPLTVNFTDLSTGNPNSWLWDFGDGTTSTERNPSHVYQAGGNFTVSLTASGRGGTNQKMKDRFISVLEAGFTATPLTGKAPLTVRFTDASKGTPTAWQWDFNNDGNIDSKDQNPTFTYPVGGTYTVSLRVIGPAGTSTLVRTSYINVVEPPTAEFTASGTARPAPFTVSFLDLSTGNPASWAWNFGDGATSTERNPSHTYAGGKFTVSLTVTNSDGTDTKTKADYIGVLDASFSASTTSTTAGTAINFTDTSAGPITGWYWSFGDGTGWFHGRNTSHTYSAPGTHTVTLIVASAATSDTEKKVNYITIR